MKAKTKLFLVLPLLLVLLAVSVPDASAIDGEVYLSQTNQNYWYTADAGEVNETWDGIRFVGNGEYLTGVEFYLKNNSVSESGMIRAVFFDNMSEFNPVDDSVPVEYSTTFYNLANLQADVWVDFEFDGGTQLEVGEYYGLAFEFFVQAGTTITFGANNPGKLFYDGESDRIYSYNNYAPCYRIYTSTTSGEPGGSPSESGMDAIIDNFIDFVVPMLVVLLPALLLVFITRRADKWLILIGLAIGVGLGYYFDMVPAWLLFLVAIGMIGLAYSEVRGNG